MYHIHITQYILTKNIYDRIIGKNNNKYNTIKTYICLQINDIK